jgi:hypothetical protein
MPEQKQITIGFSSHRPETVALAAEQMAQHEAIILEEPPHPAFAAMLRGELTFDDYLLQADYEFPEFARQSALHYRSLYQHKRQLIQCEPYLEGLDAVHEIFANGGRPGDIDPHTALGRIYATERRCAAALLAYYENCLRAPFAEVVALVKRFAREDAARNRLRDEMRAEAIRIQAGSFKTLYVEAGTLHLHLINQLRSVLAHDWHITPLYLSDTVVAKLFRRRRQPLAPGEKLTLHYTYRPAFAGRRADLLAARTLIHSKVQLKEEQLAAAGEFPHIRDEVASAILVSRLGYTECEGLYDTIKGVSTAAARARISRYLKGERR